MKWFKHYSNAHTNKLIQALLSEKNGHELHSMYWLMMELLCSEFKRDTEIFRISKQHLKAALLIKHDKKLEKFLRILREFCANFDRNLLEISEISDKFLEIKTPIILELMGKDFKRARIKSGNYAPRRKKKKKEEEYIYSQDALDAVSYLNGKTGSNFNGKSKSTHTIINARLKDYSIDDLKKVIDLKCDDWLDDEKMRKYIRPSTLFNATKFENYMNEISSKPKTAREQLIEMGVDPSEYEI